MSNNTFSYIKLGSFVAYEGERYQVLSFNDHAHLTARNAQTQQVRKLRIGLMTLSEDQSGVVLDDFGDSRWREAQNRFAIILPFIIKKRSINAIAQDHNLFYSTVFRWVNVYRKTHNILKLLDVNPVTNNGHLPIGTWAEDIIRYSLFHSYLTHHQPSLNQAILDAHLRLAHGCIVKTDNSTIRKRVSMLNNLGPIQSRIKTQPSRKDYEKRFDDFFYHCNDVIQQAHNKPYPTEESLKWSCRSCSDAPVSSVESTWIAYDQAEEVLLFLKSLLSNKTSKNLLLIGDAKNGKTTIINKFLEINPYYIMNGITACDFGASVVKPVIKCETLDFVDERSIYIAILDQIGAAFRRNFSTPHLVERVKSNIIQLDIEMIIFDDFDKIAKRTIKQQEMVLNAIDNLCIDSKVSIVLVGRHNLVKVIEQNQYHKTRFDACYLSNWRDVNNNAFYRLLSTIDHITDLDVPHCFKDKKEIEKLISKSKGSIGLLLEICSRIF
jgi:hypothetical protein